MDSIAESRSRLYTFLQVMLGAADKLLAGEDEEVDGKVQLEAGKKLTQLGITPTTKEREFLASLGDFIVGEKTPRTKSDFRDHIRKMLVMVFGEE